MPNKNQPRKNFDEEKLEALSESIKEHGIIQPIIVTKKGDLYTIVAGERRWRAAKKAGIKKIPVIIREYIAADPCPLGLPVQPNSQRAVMDVVMVDLGIHRTVKFYAGDLMPVKLMLHGNIVDLIAVDLAKGTAHVPHNCILSAIVDHIVPNNMRSDLLLIPSCTDPTEHRFHLILIARCFSGFGKFVISCGDFLSQAYRTAFGMVNMVVLNDPALAPMAAQQPQLP